MSKTVFNCSQKKLSQTMVIFYKLVHVVSGVDFGFFKFKSFKVRCVVNCLCLVQTVNIRVPCLLQTYHDADLITFGLHCLDITMFLLNQCIFMFIDRDVTLSGCMSVFEHIDSKLKVDSKSYCLEIKNFLVILLLLISRLASSFVYCYIYGLCFRAIWNSVVFLINLIICDICTITNAYVLYAVKCRLASLVRQLEAFDADVVLFHRIYKSTCEIAHKIKKNYNSVYITNLFFNVVAVMVFIVIKVIELKQKNISLWEFGVRIEYFMILLSFVVTFAPAIQAGQISAQANKVKIILYDKLLEEQDKDTAWRIERFIRYVEARPLKFRVWKVIPLDASLPGMVLSFCVTYLIVVIQFTHLH